MSLAQFFKNADCVRRPFKKKKCSDLVWFNQFSALDIAISMIQQHFIKLTLNEHAANKCILVAHICTMIRTLKYFISFFLLNKRSKHKFWTLISRSQGSQVSVSRVLCGAFYLNWTVDAYLYTLPYAFESIRGKLCVGLTLIAWFVFAPVYRKTVITNN